MTITVTLNGVGEAFDANEPNSSALVQANGYTLLIDCGHSVTPALWRRLQPDEIDGIYLTHHHADHVLGLVPLLDRFGYDGRRRALTIHTTRWGIGHLHKLFEVGFVRVGEKSPFPLDFQVAAAGQDIGPFGVELAPTHHAVVNHAILLSAGGRRFAYSGDGRPTGDSLALYRRADVLMHECFATAPEHNTPYHADLPSVAGIEGPDRIGLYHVCATRRQEMRQAIADNPRLFLAETGMTFTV